MATLPNDIEPPRRQEIIRFAIVPKETDAEADARNARSRQVFATIRDRYGDELGNVSNLDIFYLCYRIRYGEDKAWENADRHHRLLLLGNDVADYVHDVAYGSVDYTGRMSL